MVKNILLLFGGASGEHEVSCVSAGFLEKNINSANYKAISVYVDRDGFWHHQPFVPDLPENHKNNPCHLIKDKEIYIQSAEGRFLVDFAFPIIHGTTGEDGKVQGLFEFLDFPYAGSGVLSSAICMDKYYSKIIFDSAQIPQVKFKKFENHEWLKSPQSVMDAIINEFNFPVFIKPSNMGSSVGVSRIPASEKLRDAIDHAFIFDDHILCEQGVSVREIEVSILGNYPDYEISIPGEIVSSHDFYSYEAKYLDSEGARLVVPADINVDQTRIIQDLAIKSFQAVKGDGFARIDFFIDKDNSKIYLNEINTLPGFTPISMFPLLWERSGLNAVDLIHKIVHLGVEKYRRKKTLKTQRTL